jgi:hypothetical protein
MKVTLEQLAEKLDRLETKVESLQEDVAWYSRNYYWIFLE